MLAYEVTALSALFSLIGGGHLLAVMIMRLLVLMLQ
jgi:hypothetical protein